MSTYGCPFSVLSAFPHTDVSNEYYNLKWFVIDKSKLLLLVYLWSLLLLPLLAATWYWANTVGLVQCQSAFQNGTPVWASQPWDAGINVTSSWQTRMLGQKDVHFLTKKGFQYMGIFFKAALPLSNQLPAEAWVGLDSGSLGQGFWPSPPFPPMRCGCACSHTGWLLYTSILPPLK